MTGAPARRYHHRQPLFVPPPQPGAIISSWHRSRGKVAITTVGRGRAGVSASSPPSYIVTDAARARSSAPAPVPFLGSSAGSSSAPDTGTLNFRWLQTPSVRRTRQRTSADCDSGAGSTVCCGPNRRNAPKSVFSAGYLLDDDLFALAHTTLHVTDGDGRLRICLRLASRIFPVRNNYYFTDTTVTVY